jgi:hypothetical protein
MPCLAFLRLFAVPPELALLLSRASRTADGFVLPFATKSSLASPGGELVVVTTICHEIRQSHQAVAIDHVAEDEFFCGHHTPAPIRLCFFRSGNGDLARDVSAASPRRENVSSGHVDADQMRTTMLSVAAHIGQAKVRNSKPGLSCSRSERIIGASQSAQNGRSLVAFHGKTRESND